VLDAPKRGRAADSDIVLEARSLARLFGEGDAAVHAVRDVDLIVARGEIVLIMGPSGSGKTTLLTLLGGLLRPTSGSIRLFGRELSGLSEAELSRLRLHSVGFVFQTFNLLESLTAIQNVEIALNLAGVRGKVARARAQALLTRVGLEHRLQFHVQKLSGGERQRVSIARALANDPPLILADEPTANLDSGHGMQVVELIRDVAREESRTVIIVSHDARIRGVADRVLWLEDGRLTSDGGAAD
jgi:putative ABC transport system ATP-binding protein